MVEIEQVMKDKENKKLKEKESEESKETLKAAMLEEVATEIWKKGRRNEGRKDADEDFYNNQTQPDNPNI